MVSAEAERFAYNTLKHPAPEMSGMAIPAYSVSQGS